MKFRNKFLSLLTIAFSFLITDCTNSNVALVKTATVANITMSTATVSGEILWDGGSKVTSRGICWNTNQYPKITDNKIAAGDSVSFTLKITGLAKNTTYYARAYAVNSEGPSYGEELSFTTFEPSIPVLTTADATNITLTSATVGGNVTSDGGSAVSERGICWGTTTGPTISTNKVASGSGTGSFTTDLSSLQGGVKYFVRAYAINTIGIAYGNEITFSTTQPTLPAITTIDATSLTQTSATVGGNVTADGGFMVTERGVCWSTSSQPTVSNNKVTSGTGTGSFSCVLNSLTNGTKYYARAYAVNLLGTVYGNEVTFTTVQASLPSITTIDATNVTQTGATTGGNVTSDGGLIVTERGVCWNTSTSPTTANNKSANGTGTGSFTSILSSLANGTTYHVRAYAINLIGTVYGNEITFTTGQQQTVAVLSTIDATSITQTSAVVGGNITSNGGASVTERGVCWSTTASPTTSNSKLSNGTGSGSYTCTLSSLNVGTTYHARAYAINSVGTAYGNEVTFTTSQATLATISTTAANSVTQTTAVLGGLVTSDGGASITDRGVCYNTSSSPTISNSKVSGGTGTGSFNSSLSGLTAGTTYYARAYATNSAGTAYGNEVSFTTTAVVSNSAGTLSISTLTSAAGGGYQPKNIVAIWIKTSAGTFVKSLLVYAATRKADLTHWSSNTGKSVTDAITGATQSSHATRTCTWDGTNTSKVLMPNGDYIVCMELCDGKLNYHEVTFTKGPTAVTLSPSNLSSFNNISIIWTPK